MNLQPGWRRWLQELVTPASSPALEELLRQHQNAYPVLWLLGKAGAGKSSIVQRLTGDSRAAIGNGFAPCTKTAMYYDHPADAPVMRFLDTRGLGETNYDPADDLAEASSGSHAL
ncbi:MAG: putative GTPase, partial [Pseudomonadales bacterium]